MACSEKALKEAALREDDYICQTLGKALGYPWFKDDQKNFPGATEASGVCVGEHVAMTIASEAAKRIASLEAAAVAGHAQWNAAVEAAALKAVHDPEVYHAICSLKRLK